MKKVLFTLTLCCLLVMPCILQAEEVVIPLFEVITMSPLPGDDPLDDPERSEEDPPRPTDFRATINSHSFSVTRLNSDILSAQATVVNATTGSVVVNEVFTESMQEQIPNAGAYILNILTAGGALTGQFMVQ
jgi:hypothetical protein